MKLFKNVATFSAAIFLVFSGSASHAQSGSKLTLVGAGEFEKSHSSFPPRNVIDGSTAHRSRWASYGEPRNVWVDLGSVQRVTEVGVAWDRGDKRKHDFEIRAHTSLSGSWDKVYRGEASGKKTGVEVYNVDDVDARYIRIKVFGNNAEKWQNITEVEVYGKSGSQSANDPVTVVPVQPESTGGSGQFGLDPKAEPWENFDLRFGKILLHPY